MNHLAFPRFYLLNLLLQIGQIRATTLLEFSLALLQLIVLLQQSAHLLQQAAVNSK